jgi:hypothetical protein
MATEPEIVTLAQIVHRAVEVVDPDGADEALVEFLQRFEDFDEPASALTESIQSRMAEATGVYDPQEESGPVQVAGAVVVYLTHRRDEVDDDPENILRLTARAEFDGNPPPVVANWYDQNGIDY